MSRYASRDYVDRFLESRRGVYAGSTWQRGRRRYDRMFRDILRLYGPGGLSTLSPG